MAKMRRVAVCVALAITAGACGSAQPTVMTGDADTDATTLADQTDDTANATSVAGDSAPIDFGQSPVDEDGNGIPDDWLPVPELSPEVIADEVLLQDMTFLSELAADDEEHWDYMAMIGVSQYSLVDANGQPIDSDDEQFSQYLLTVNAYHGKSEPVVYSAFMQHWLLHPERGVQTACGGLPMAVLEEGPNEWFELHFDRALDVFEDRVLYGDFDCDLADGLLPEAFDGRFTIDKSEGKNLRITNEGGAVAHLEFVEAPDNLG